MLKRFRYSPIHRALSWLLLCAWLTLVGATAAHHHPLPRLGSPAGVRAAAHRNTAARTSVVAAERDDDCSVCKWLCAIGHTVLPVFPPRIVLERAAMPEHPLARPPTWRPLAFASSSRGPPLPALTRCA